MIAMAGRRFGYLTVIGDTPTRIGKKQDLAWLCRCDCGVEKIINGSNLRQGQVHTCGSRECHRKYYHNQESIDRRVMTRLRNQIEKAMRGIFAALDEEDEDDDQRHSAQSHHHLG